MRGPSLMIVGLIITLVVLFFWLIVLLYLGKLVLDWFKKKFPELDKETDDERIERILKEVEAYSPRRR